MATAMGVGSGSLEKEDRKQIINAWKQQAETGLPKPKKAVVSKAQRRVMLAAMGIDLVEIPRKK